MYDLNKEFLQLWEAWLGVVRHVGLPCRCSAFSVAGLTFGGGQQKIMFCIKIPGFVGTKSWKPSQVVQNVCLWWHKDGSKMFQRSLKWAALLVEVLWNCGLLLAAPPQPLPLLMRWSAIYTESECGAWVVSNLKAQVFSPQLSAMFQHFSDFSSVLASSSFNRWCRPLRAFSRVFHLIKLTNLD